MADDDDKPIIIVKKGGGHGGHHGGAWKVAYADFVTAMMAFFMVMWLLNSAEVRVRKAVASYFRKPGIFENGSPHPIDAGAGMGIFKDSYQPPKPNDLFDKWQMRKRLPTLKEEIEEALRERRRQNGLSAERSKKRIDPHAALVESPPEKEGVSVKGTTRPGQLEPDKGSIELPFVFQADKQGADKESPAPPSTAAMARKRAAKAITDLIKQQLETAEELRALLGNIDIKIDAHGLEIEIMETEKTSMFTSGSARIRPQVYPAFKKLVEIISPLPAAISVIGHTDAKPFSRISKAYTNWDLSTDRANQARKVLIEQGLQESSIVSVNGRAAQQLKLPEEPFHPSNRRITLRMDVDYDAIRAEEEQKEGTEQENEESGLAPSSTIATGPKLPEVKSISIDELIDDEQVTDPAEFVRRVRKLTNEKLVPPEEPVQTPQNQEAPPEVVASPKELFSYDPVFSLDDMW